MVPVSICIIAKNEEKQMDHFLSAIQKHLGTYPHEIVIVDTGSSDRTVEIAQKYTDKVFFFEWINDFSAARNFSLECAQNDWVLVLDCDEYITELNPITFDLMAKQHPQQIGVIARRNHYEMNGADSIYTDPVERFFNRKIYHYESIIHEQLRRIDGHDDYKRIDISLVVEHSGYTGTPEELLAKVNRNNDLLLKMLEQTPDDPYLYFQIGQSYNMIHDYEKACHYYGKGLDYATNPRLSYVILMIISYGYALINLERYEDALMLENVYDDFCHTADFVCLMGIIYLRNGMVANAIQEFFKATTIDNYQVEGANSFIPTYNMGCINEVLGNIDDAINLYQKCGDFQPALNRLAVLKSDNH